MAEISGIKRICVFCGASVGTRGEYVQAAVELGKRMGGAGLGLVYGGTSIGLMGQIADAVLGAGGEVIGVLPRPLKDKEFAHLGLTELLIVDSLTDRKHGMFDLSDAFAALPGGMGTLDELSEVLSWAQLGYHAKPVGLLNTAGYFNPLLGFLDYALSEGFLKEKHRRLLGVRETPEALLDYFTGLTDGRGLTTAKVVSAASD